MAAKSRTGRRGGEEMRRERREGGREEERRERTGWAKGGREGPLKG